MHRPGLRFAASGLQSEDDVSRRPAGLIGHEIFSAMPDAFRRKGVRTEWADANRPGQPTDCFIEGPCLDADGNLYIVDIPFGRIFRIAPDGDMVAGGRI